MLLGAVLAAVCFIGTQANANWAADNKTNGYIYWYGDASTEVVAPTTTEGVSNPNLATKPDRFTNYYLCSEGVAAEKTLTSLSGGDGVAFTVCVNPWDTNKGFGLLTIETLKYGENGSGSFNVKTSNSVSIEQISGTLSSVNNAGTLTLGTAESTTKLSGTMTNSGVLNLNGVIEIADLSGFDTILEGSLSNTTHGYRSGTEKAVIASGGGTINLSGVTLKIGSEETTLEDGALAQAPIAISTGNTSTSTVYEITSAYTTAVEYNGTSGDTATATGFHLENGTTLKLTGTSTEALTDKVTIAAGEGGKATYSIANGVEQTYASLGLGDLINVESGSYVLDISGDGTVVKTDHSGGSSSHGFHAGEVSITNGGKLVLQAVDGLGWEGGATPKLSILNATLALGARQTFSTDLDMQGGAVIEATETTQTGNNVPKIDVWKNMDWTVSGEGNVVREDVAIKLRENVTITVEEGGDLSIMGAYDTQQGGKITKSGEGKLILAGVAKNLDKGINLTGGTLQLGGTTADDGQVTLSGGVNQSAGTIIDVAGKAALSGSSTLAGAVNVLATGELTLNSTYDVTGSFTLKAGGKVIAGSGLSLTGDATLPEANTNGWSTSSACVLTTSGSGTVTGLNSIWDNGVEVTVNSSLDEETGVTSYIATKKLDYYVQDTATKAEYSSESGLLAARDIYMSDGTTMVVKTNLNHNSEITLVDGAKVNYEVDGAALTVDKNGTEEGISSITLSNGATLKVANAFGSLGTEANKVAINMGDGTGIQLANGNTWANRNLWADILVDGEASIAGSTSGNNSTVRGTIAGNGNLKLTQAYGTNEYTIASVISDGTTEGNKLAVEVNSTNNNIKLSGANTYSGGTTVTAGRLTTVNESALGTGKVTMNGGTLNQNEALSISSMEYTGGTVEQNGHALTVAGKLTVKSNMTIGHAEAEGVSASTGAISIGTLDLTAGTTLTTYGSLTIGTLDLDLSKYTDMEATYTLVSSLGTDASVVLTNAYTSTVGSYKATVTGSGTSELTLSFTDLSSMTTAEGYVTGCVGLEGEMLTLNFSGDIDSEYTSSALVTGIDGSIMKDILGLAGLPEDGMVGITLQDADGHTITATADQMIGFLGKDGESVYYGQNVGSAWQYQVQYIPEPATATLSLLALAGLAARRRRK